MNQSKNCFAMSNKDITEGFNLKNDKLVVGSTQIDYRFALGAGSICSNVNDLLKWQIRFHYQKKILSNSGYNEMVKRTKLKDGGETNYGLGLEIDQYNGNTVISHNGVIDGYLSDTRYFPSKELSIVILSNTLGRAKPSKISNQISKYFLTPKVITKPFTGNAASFIGIYEGKVMGNASRISVTSNSGVVSIESRGNKSVLKYLGNETFIAEDNYTYFFKNDILQVNGPKLSIIFRKIK